MNKCCQDVFPLCLCPPASNLHRRLSHVCYWQWNNQTRSAGKHLAANSHVWRCSPWPSCSWREKRVAAVLQCKTIDKARFTDETVPICGDCGTSTHAERGFFLCCCFDILPKMINKNSNPRMGAAGLVAQCCMLLLAEQNKDTFTHSRLSCRCHF